MFPLTLKVTIHWGRSDWLRLPKELKDFWSEMRPEEFLHTFHFPLGLVDNIIVHQVMGHFTAIKIFHEVDCATVRVEKDRFFDADHNRFYEWVKAGLLANDGRLMATVLKERGLPSTIEEYYAWRQRLRE